MLDNFIMPLYDNTNRSLTITELAKLIACDNNGSICENRNVVTDVEFDCNDESEFCNGCALAMPNRKEVTNAIKKHTIEKLRNS